MKEWEESEFMGKVFLTIKVYHSRIKTNNL